MRVLLQRVKCASVIVDGRTVGSIGEGLLVFLAVASDDTGEDLDYLSEKVLTLRIFRDTQGRMNRSVNEVGGSVLVVSQFTLYASTKKGRRPWFSHGATPDRAREMYDLFVARVGQVVSVQTGEFGAKMEVELINDGPVTILLDSRVRE